MERFDFIDYDEGRDRDPREAFYTEALPCESCGAPVDERRPAPWDESLQVGPCCYDLPLEVPEIPTCSDLYAVMMACVTVGELVDATKAHKAVCQKCGGMPLERAA
jgi:hypothetical protein